MSRRPFPGLRPVRPEEYDKMAAAEAVMWWYHALHANLAWLLARYVTARGTVLDAGCGTGGLMRRIARLPEQFKLMGLDIDLGAAKLARDKSGCAVAVGNVNQLPFEDASFSAIISADVLYHRMADPGTLVRESFRCLAPGGVLVANAPAYQWLHSYHDDAIHTARRFTRPQLVALLAAAGFSVSYSSYWNSLLFPLMVLKRKLLPAPKEGSDVLTQAGPLDRVFRMITSLEHGLMRLGLRFPFGGSCIVVGIKND